MSPIELTLQEARSAQAEWEQRPIDSRLRSVRDLRHRIASDPQSWAEAIQTPQGRTHAESLGGEVLPLADACRWLEKHASKTLRARRSGGWFSSLDLRVAKKPIGVVLVIGASNYPLFLLAVPAIQALAAGNAVVLKPPPGAEAIAEKFRQALMAVGIDPRLCPLIDSSAEAAQQAIAAGVDHVVATGSSNTGRAVASSAAEKLTPCTLECSGSDAVIVLPGADLDRVADCVAWGLPFNSGATCIGPRRLILFGEKLAALRGLLIERLIKAKPRKFPRAAVEAVSRVVLTELGAGTEVVFPACFDQSALDLACEAGELPPLLLLPKRRPSAVNANDLFAPVMTIEQAASTEDAIALANESPFALGASVFGPRAEAQRVADRLRAGCVTVNDMIAPTADPGVPFGGTGESGYGVTRGAEGLLAMTRPQAIVTRRGSWLPHLDEPTPAMDDLLAGMIQMNHAAGWSARFAGLRRLITAASAHKKSTER